MDKFDTLYEQIMQEMFSFTDEIDKHAKRVVQIYYQLKREDEPLGSTAKLDRAMQIWHTHIEREVGEDVPMAALLDVREATRHLLNRNN